MLPLDEDRVSDVADGLLRSMGDAASEQDARFKLAVFLFAASGVAFGLGKLETHGAELPEQERDAFSALGTILAIFLQALGEGEPLAEIIPESAVKMNLEAEAALDAWLSQFKKRG
jgi:predicted membrane-bound spermidine synthase